MTELNEILTKFRDCGWDLIAGPAGDWLDGKGDYNVLLAAVKQADEECGSCGCDFDPLYRRVLEILDLAKKAAALHAAVPYLLRSPRRCHLHPRKDSGTAV